MDRWMNGARGAQFIHSFDGVDVVSCWANLRLFQYIKSPAETFLNLYREHSGIAVSLGDLLT